MSNIKKTIIVKQEEIWIEKLSYGPLTTIFMDLPFRNDLEIEKTNPQNI